MCWCFQPSSWTMETRDWPWGSPGIRKFWPRCRTTSDGTGRPARPQPPRWAPGCASGSPRNFIALQLRELPTQPRGLNSRTQRRKAPGWRTPPGGFHALSSLLQQPLRLGPRPYLVVDVADQLGARALAQHAVDGGFDGGAVGVDVGHGRKTTGGRGRVERQNDLPSFSPLPYSGEHCAKAMSAHALQSFFVAERRNAHTQGG